MIASARTIYILNRLNETGIVDYKSVAAELTVSEATVRRDFEKLERQGKLRRVHGGAVSSKPEAGEFGAELSIRAKHSINSREKKLAAAAAAQMVRPGECVFLDVGTSIAPIADHLLKMPVRIVTCNNLVLQKVAPESPAEVFLVGGRFMPADHMFVGALAENMLENFGFNRAFVGCMGLDAPMSVAYATDMECVRIKQLAIRNAEKSYLLADASKLHKVGLFRFARLQSFERIFLAGEQPPGDYPDNVEWVKE